MALFKRFMLFLILLLNIALGHAQVKIYRDLRTGEIFGQSNFISKLSKKGDVPLVSLISDKNTRKDTVVYYFLATYGIQDMVDMEKRLDSVTIGRFLHLKKESFLYPSEFIKYDPNKPTFLALWFIECKGCITELPYINVLKEKFDTDINFIALTFDGRTEIKEFLKTHRFDFIHLSDNNLVDSLGDFAYPRLFLLDKEQKIKWSTSGILETEVDGYQVILNVLLKGGEFERFYLSD